MKSDPFLIFRKIGGRFAPYQFLGWDGTWLVEQPGAAARFTTRQAAYDFAKSTGHRYGPARWGGEQYHAGRVGNFGVRVAQ
jgi:hypothetical protein